MIISHSRAKNQNDVIFWNEVINDVIGPVGQGIIQITDTSVYSTDIY